MATDKRRISPARPSPAKSMYPHLPSALDDVRKLVRGDPPGNPASRIYQNLKSSGYSRAPAPMEPRSMWNLPKAAMVAPRRKREK
jgi:hypothetical protein